MGLLESIERTVFLGEEFLTWLWYRSENNPNLDLAKLGQIQIQIAQPLTLRGDEGADATLVTLKGDRAGASAEARAALREGKKLWKCRAIFKQGDLAWPCALNADALAIASLGLPVPRGVPMPDGLLMRAEKLEEFTQLLFAVFEQFLELRLRDKNWDKTEKAIKDWVAGE
mgnify:CR=1 FL=1